MQKGALQLAFWLAISILIHGALLFFEPGRLDASRPTTVSLSLVLLPADSAQTHRHKLSGESKIASKTTAEMATTADGTQKDRFSKKGVFKANIDDYIPSNLLTSRPRPAEDIDLTLEQFKVDGLVGEADLLILISSNGAVDSVLVLDSSLPQALVDYAAATFKRAKFVPGFINQHAVRSQFVVKLGTPAIEPVLDDQPKSLKK